MTRRGLLLALFAPTDWVAADGSPFPSSSWRRDGDAFTTIAGLETFQDIKTVQLYTELDFQFEFQLGPQGNSGIKYQLEKFDRWQPPGKAGFHIRARGPEFQLCDDRITTDSAKQCGSLYGKQPPLQPPALKLDAFNTGRLVIRGRRVEHWVNGQLVLAYDREQLVASAISLQHHNTPVTFRRLRINP